MLADDRGAEARFAIETKRAHSTNLVEQLRMYDAVDGTLPLVFITEYVSPPLRRKLDAAGISYLDTTGWVSLTSSDPTVLVRLEGSPKPPRPRPHTATVRLNGPAAARAIRRLLEEQPPVGIRELAAKSLSSAAAVSKLMPTLVDAGAIERSEDGTIILIRKRTLLDRWTVDYSYVRSNGVVLDYVAPRGVVRTLDQIRGRTGIVVSGSAAAREYLPTEITSAIPMTTLTLYGNSPMEIARELELVRTAREIGNVMITVPRDKTLLETAEISASGLRRAPVGQVLADLLTVPIGRLAQEAEQLIDVMTRDDRAWLE